MIRDSRWESVTAFTVHDEDGDGFGRAVVHVKTSHGAYSAGGILDPMEFDVDNAVFGLVMDSLVARVDDWLNRLDNLVE